MFCKSYAGTKLLNNCQVIPSHGNPQIRQTLFDGYLFKYCSVKYQTFHQVSEKTSQQTYSHQRNHLKSFQDASKSHKTCPIELTSSSFLIGGRGHFDNFQESPGGFGVYGKNRNLGPLRMDRSTRYERDVIQFQSLLSLEKTYTG